MPAEYHVIEVFTSEAARFEGRPIAQAIIDLLRKERIAARCIVFRGQAGYYENGEVTSSKLEILSYNLPLKIEIIFPAAELDLILPQVTEIVTDGIVVVEDMRIQSHRSRYRPIPRQLRVRDIMASDPVNVTKDTPVSRVVEILLAAEFNALPVVDEDGVPVGIITQGDLVRRADMPLRLGLLEALKHETVDDFMTRAQQMTAEQIMTQPLVTVADDRPVSDAVALMRKRGLKRLPVVDAQGKLVGVVTRLDVFKTVTTRPGPGVEPSRPQYVEWEGVPHVCDVMNRETGTVHPDTSIQQVLQTLSGRRVQRVAVVDEDDHLLGLVTDKDIIAALGHRSPGLLRSIIDRLPLTGGTSTDISDITLDTTAGEIMETELFTINDDATLDEALQLMVDHALKRLPVVDNENHYKGMISRAELLKMTLQG